MSENYNMKNIWNKRALEDAIHYIETSEYSSDIRKFFSRGKELTDILLELLNRKNEYDFGKMTLLEMGCGAGRMSGALSKKFQKVLATDVSGEMINLAIMNHPEDDYPNISFIETDGILANGIEDKSVDIVLSYEVFQHLPTYEIAAGNFRDMYRALKDGGIIYIHFKCEVSFARKIIRKLYHSRPLSWFRNSSKNDPTWTGKAYDEEGIRKLCEDTGFRVKEILPDPTHPPGERVFLVAEKPGKQH